MVGKDQKITAAGTHTQFTPTLACLRIWQHGELRMFTSFSLTALSLREFSYGKQTSGRPGPQVYHAGTPSHDPRTLESLYKGVCTYLSLWLDSQFLEGGI